MVITTTGFRKEVNLRSYSTHQFTPSFAGVYNRSPWGTDPGRNKIKKYNGNDPIVLLQKSFLFLNISFWHF